jgi:hypothetical protein
VVAIGAGGEFGLDVMLAPTKEDRTDALAEGWEVPVVGRAAFFIEVIELAVEAKEWPEK